ncbi:MAG: hypothetical protein PHH54_05255 [Candidatus Nanoarchaeia archaeon]|nr:hypothetical protein [Candidatus Nanoarchaeia archaeon]MDD5741365.1 hypothetical protein [Candidatus Nanoarchaeia archaeon]
MAKTLKDLLLDEGVKGKQFVFPSQDGSRKIYTVLGAETDKADLTVKYSDGKVDSIPISSHFDDEEFSTKTVPGKFYKSRSAEGSIFFCAKEGKLIDYLNRESEAENTGGLDEIENPENHINFLLADAEKSRDYASFIRRCLDSGYLAEDTSLGYEDDYRLAEDHELNREPTLEEIEGDVNLDTFGSGSGLLDLSLQADDTSLRGFLDEIYTPENQHEQKPEDSDEDAGSGLLDLSVQAKKKNKNPVSRFFRWLLFLD